MLVWLYICCVFLARVVHLAGVRVITVIKMQSIYRAEDAGRGRVGRKLDNLVHKIGTWLSEPGRSLAAIQMWVAGRLAPDIKSLVAVAMEEAAHAQLRHDEVVLERVEEDLGRQLADCKRQLRMREANLVVVRKEVQELKSRMQQMEQGGEVQSNHHSPCSYR